MKPSALIRTLFAASTLACATAGMAQTAGPNPVPPAAVAAPANPSVPGAAPAATQAATPAATQPPAAEPAKPEVLDPVVEAERKKAEAVARKKKEEARLQAERASRCVIKPVMSDAEIARCR